MNTSAATDNTKAEWSAQLLERAWVDVLRAESLRTSQAKAAKRLGVSGSVVSQILQGRYGGPFGGDIERMQQLVEGELMESTVHCPVLGELARNRCLEYQNRPLAATNPTRVALFKTCPECPNNRRNQ